MTALGKLDDLPQARLTHGPTPMEPLDRLSAENTGGRLWAKRDDMQGLAFGGNKVRQLAFYFGAAQAAGADTVLITGAIQSNYCRLTAAFAAKLGMECHLQLEERVPSNDPLYRESGNVLLDRLMGATLHHYAAVEDEAGADANLERLAEDLRDKGRTPYVIHLAPGHPPLGALGYVDGAREMLDQAAEMGIAFDQVVCASGSGATHAGLLFGLRALGFKGPVTGICVRRAAALQKPRILQRCAEIAALLGIENPVAEEDVIVSDRWLKPGYGRLNLPTERAIRMAARTEALMVDPVYTGKALAGALAAAGNLKPDENVLFVHTGGTPGLFGYGNSLEGVLAPLP
ncbi:MAG: D-cysteine desulfhydrase family protein [Pseudomonadota bacterium]